MTQTNWTWEGTAPAWAYPAVAAWARSHCIAIGILLLALVQGLVFLVVVPPWQHYDEPTHFEYAWLIANRGRLPLPYEMDQVMRREVAASMLAHNFYQNLPKPDLLTDKGVIEIGISELVHPPAYYLLVSGPLRLARYLDITAQLYIARLVSVVLFVLTIGIALGLMRDLVPHGHVLRWAVPLTLVLLPPFADVMTSVNNDAGAVVVFSLFLWLSVRTIRYGIAWRRALLLCGSAALSVVTKNTAAVALVLLPLVFLLAAWSQRGWRWRWLSLATLAAFATLLLTTLGWGDAAIWYRRTLEAAQSAATRAQSPAAPVGTYVLQLDAPAAGSANTLLNPLVAADVAQLAGQEITAGGWVWATQPISSATLNLDYAPYGLPTMALSTLPLTITTAPTFVAWSTTVPSDVSQLHYRISVEPTVAGQPVRLFMDGALLVHGRFAAAEPPVFADTEANQGTWAGRTFTNTIRNGSAERAWPRLQAWVDQLLVTYVRRSPSLVLSSLFDVERTAGSLLFSVSAQTLFAFFGVFGWGHVRLERTTWLPVFLSIVVVAGLGCCRWITTKRRDPAGPLNAMLTLLGIAGLLVWSNVVLRGLPLLEGRVVFAAPRYGFPAVLPAVLAIVGGWWAIWSPRLRLLGMQALLVAITGLDILAVWTIWSFYQSLPT